MSATQEIETKITVDASESRAEIEGLRSQIEELRRELGEIRSPRFSILREPLTYEARLVRDKNSQNGLRAISTREDHCFIRDLALYRTDYAARQRMDRHETEMRHIREAQDENYSPDLEYEQRTVNWTAGTGGYFAPPLWIVEQFAYQPTPERVLSELAPKFELPEGVQSVNLPAWTTGADVAPSGVGSPVATSATVDTAISSAVTTIAGNYDVPLQMLEQSPVGAHLDWVAFTAMEARYGYQLELQLINGVGAATPQGSGNNQILGIYNNTAIPAANNVAFANSGTAAESASVTTGAALMFPFIGLMIGKVGQARFLPPENIMMSTSRMAWMGTSEDTATRPLMIANSDGSGSWDLVSINVKVNDAIPRTSGVGANEDRIIACRPSDWLVLESDRRTQVMVDTLSGSLMARLQMRRYAAALLRYPTSVAYLSGAGMGTGGGF